MPKDCIKISVDDRTVQIVAHREGHKGSSSGGYLTSSSWSGHAQRQFQIPKNCEPSSLKVVGLENGVLELDVTRMADAPTPPRRNVPIQ